MKTTSRLRKLSGRSPIVIVDCLCAVFELARANRSFRNLPPRELVDHVRTSPIGTTQPDGGKFDTRLVERVAFAIPAIALRVPWRSDCMVQAMAAQSWLGRYNISSTMTIGVCKDAPTGFGAHAWLSVGNVVVTGGDISGYVAIETPASNLDLASPNN